MQKDHKPIHVLTTFLSVFCFVLGRLSLFCFFPNRVFSVLPWLFWNSQKSSLSPKQLQEIFFVVFILFYFIFQNFKESQTSQVAVAHS